jgi:hypothetical protein
MVPSKQNVSLGTSALKGMVPEVSETYTFDICSRSPTGRVHPGTKDESFGPFGFRASQRAGCED